MKEKGNWKETPRREGDGRERVDIRSQACRGAEDAGAEVCAISEIGGRWATLHSDQYPDGRCLFHPGQPSDAKAALCRTVLDPTTSPDHQRPVDHDDVGRA
jgi:hypothetical protein